MSFMVFKDKMESLASQSGVGVRVFEEEGKYIARFSNGDTITGNSISKSVRVCWGSGHSAHAEI